MTTSLYLMPEPVIKLDAEGYYHCHYCEGRHPGTDRYGRWAHRLLVQCDVPDSWTARDGIEVAPVAAGTLAGAVGSDGRTGAYVRCFHSADVPDCAGQRFAAESGCPREVMDT